MAKRKPGAQNVPEPTKEQITGQTDLFEATHETALPSDAGKEMDLEAEPHITVDIPPIDPKVNPNSPEFDLNAWKAAVRAMDRATQQSTQAIIDNALHSMIQSLNRVAESGTRIMMQRLADDMASSMADIDQVVQNAIAALTASFRKLNEFAEEHKDEIEAALATSATEKLAMPQGIVPFLLQELEELREEPQYAEYTVSDILLNEFDGDGNPTEKMAELLERAQARKEEYDKVAELTAAAERAAENLPLVLSIVPQSHTMPNNALMNALQQKPTINAGAFDLTVANERGRRKEITAYTMVSYDAGETGITITDAKLSEYERQVSDAIISLWQEAQKQGLPTVFTTDMIYRAMPGGGDKATPQQKGAITKTIEKFRRLHITVDATEEMQKRGIIEKGGKCSFDSFYLSATHGEYKVKSGGQSVSAYRIDSEPIILTYSKMTSQLLSVDAKYIEVKKVKSGHVSTELVMMNSGRQAMTGYMLRRIAVMKRDKANKHQTQSHTILFDTLFKEAGTATTDRKQTGLNRNFCFEVMDFWKAKGFIRDYQKQTKGRSITGIEIIL